MKSILSKSLTLLLFALTMPGISCAASGCSTERLQAIMQQLPYIDIAPYQAGGNYLIYNQKYTISIRINSWNEVSHVGLKILPDTLREQNELVCDFVERYLLELSLLPAEQMLVRMRNDDVVFENGVLRQFLSLTESDIVAMQTIDFKSYKIKWKRGNKEMAILFPMDYELLSGCNLIELESNYLRDLQRYLSTKKSFPSKVEYLDDGYYLQDEGTFLSPKVRNELCFHGEEGECVLACDMQHSDWSARNIAISDMAVGNKAEDFMLEMTLDRYGYDSTVLHIPMCELVSFNKSNGCTPYFLLKTEDEDAIKGTVFFANRNSGYCHILYLEIPTEAISKRSGTLKGRLFIHIPSHNVSKNYFN